MIRHAFTSDDLFTAYCGPAKDKDSPWRWDAVTDWEFLLEELFLVSLRQLQRNADLFHCTECKKKLT